jgi:SAM-dependent methyltransferase
MLVPKHNVAYDWLVAIQDFGRSRPLMKTDSKEYEVYLRNKFLPGRTTYLEWVLYPRYFTELPQADVWDLGFGMGELLEYCKKRGIQGRGIDSNPYFVERAKERGLQVQLDDITRMDTVPDGALRAVVSDNVLEHLEREDVFKVFSQLRKKLATGGVFLVVVPGERGFALDATHRTFVDENLIREACHRTGLLMTKQFRWPVNSHWVSRVFYLNMTVFKIELPANGMATPSEANA